MAVKIRLARYGAKKAPYYRVVVADGRARRDGRFIEIIGRYDPRTEPSTVELNLDKVDSWVAKGAQPTEAAGKLIAIARGETAAPAEEAKVSKKAQAKAVAEADAAAKAADEAAAAKAAPAEAPAEEPAAEAQEAPAEEAPAEEPEAAAPAEEAPAVEEAPTEELAAEAEEAPAVEEAPADEAAE